MNRGDIYLLKKDVEVSFPPKKKYTVPQGSEVIIIRTSDIVAIVELKSSGDRFTVKIDDLGQPGVISAESKTLF